eukprot:jgi/Orpsp1_1/1187641/evm.model.d7180000059173.1
MNDTNININTNTNTNMENSIPRLDWGEEKITKEYTLKYESSAEYIFKISLNNNNIKLSAKKKENFTNSIYKKKYTCNDFHKLIKNENFNILYNNSRKIFNFLTSSFEEEKITIKEIINNKNLIIYTKLELVGLGVIEITIPLPKEQCNNYELIENLCNGMNHLISKCENLEMENEKIKEENKNIREENENIKEENKELRKIMEKHLNITEYNINKFKIVLYNRDINATSYKIDSWKYVEDPSTSFNYYIKEYNNNIIIGYGFIPGKCYIPDFENSNNGNNVNSQPISDTISNGWYYIKGLRSGNYLHATSGHSGANVDVSSFTGASNQKWLVTNSNEGNYITLMNGSGEFYLDVYCSKNEDATNIQIYTTRDNNAQKFVLEKRNNGYLIKTVVSNCRKAVDESGSTNVHQWTIHGESNQIWIFEKTTNANT